MANDEHYIPARPSVNIKVVHNGEVEIDVWQMADGMDKLENVTVTLPAATATEMAEAILLMLKD
jgi:hypothetical protein